MRRPWIKVEVSTPDKPEICAIASRLRLDEDAVVGKLIRLWSWAELNRVNPNDLNVTKEFLDKLVSKKGFTEAMIFSGWLGTDGERLFFPNFGKHNGEDSKVRGLTAKRVEKHRKNKLSKNDSIVTQEESREQNASAKPETTNDLNNVQNRAISLSTSEPSNLESASPEEMIETPQELPASDTVEILESENNAPEVVPETIKKRRTKAETSSDEQPMLF